MKHINYYEANDGKRFETEEECIKYEKSKKVIKKLKEIKDVDRHGYGEWVTIYVNELHQIMASLDESYPHEGGRLFNGTMEDFISQYENRFLKKDSSYAHKVISEINNYKCGRA